MNRLDRLRKLNISEIGSFTLKNRKTIGKVVEIYNSNTCLIILGFDNVIFKFKCKLYNTQVIDSYNSCTTFKDLVSSPQSSTLCKNEKILSIYCRDFTDDGYLLVDLYDMDSNLSINKELIEKNDSVSQYDHSADKLFVFA